MSVLGVGRVERRATSGTLAQVCALLALRWQMAREPGLRFAVVLGALAVVWLLTQAARAGAALDVVSLATALELAPAGYLGFGALALVAPLAAGGGAEVVPEDQLVGFPVRSTTSFVTSLLLAPLNLVWLVQLLGLAALTSCLTLDGSLVRGGATTLAYVVAATLLGQTAAWAVVGLRRTAAGRRTVAAAGVLLLGALVVVVRAGRAGDVLAHSPSSRVVDGVIAGGDGHLARWGLVTGVLLLAAAAGLLLGARACRWALRRPGDAGAHRLTGPVRRRSVRSGPLRSLVALDRASVWRTPALRRGSLVLALLPGLVAAGSAAPWASLVVLPGLVAAGAAMLFGINTFALDGSGALWLASLPHDPALALRAKAVVLTETVGAILCLTCLTASLGTPAAPTAAELSALLVAALLCTAVVVAVALRTSVQRPRRAELRGPRDTVAPPGALLLASVRLAAPTAAIGIVMSAATTSGRWQLPVLLALPVLLLCGSHLAGTARSWDDPARRARVVTIVSAG